MVTTVNRMKDKIVFITGASSGIGEACARKFASQGANLILNARNVPRLDELKKRIGDDFSNRSVFTPF